VAKFNLTKLLSSIKGQLSNSAKENVKRLIPDVSAVTDATFGAAITSEHQASLKALAKKMGVKYQGKTLDIWEGDDSFGCRLPTIYSDGKRPVINWAGQVVPLSGDVQGTFIGSELRVDNAQASLRIPVRLAWENDTEKEQAEQALPDLETWEEVLGILRIQADWLKREDMFAGGIEKITCIDVAAKEGPTGKYWAITGDDGKQVFKFSLPEKADPKVGDVVTVDAEAKALVLNGVAYESIHFVKVTELEVGKVYEAITLKEKTGDYPGWTLTIPGVGLVDANSQISRWIENTGVLPDQVSKEHPIQIKVIEIRKGGNGKMMARLTIDLLDDSVGLAALLGASTGQSAKLDKPDDEEVDADTPELFKGAVTDIPASDDDDWL